jgi:hypothetical protein
MEVLADLCVDRNSGSQLVTRVNCWREREGGACDDSCE